MFTILAGFGVSASQFPASQALALAKHGHAFREALEPTDLVRHGELGEDPLLGLTFSQRIQHSAEYAHVAAEQIRRTVSAALRDLLTLGKSYSSA